uniref:Reverse transcriptase domain-containing protein n=1 Tax=Cyprinus carpio TaxID=7962 RepID=A0A8C1Y2M1_CYPCA
SINWKFKKQKENYFYKRTKQGCPLSPLLFNLVIEPLVLSIRMSEEIEGIETESSSHKISLNADDVLLFLKNPTKSIPLLIKMIENFSKFSGYKINYEKSLAFPLGDRIISLSYQPFKVTTKGFKYLGIYFSADLSNLIKHNLLPVITNLSLSLLDRIAIIKMNGLPPLLYIIQMLPIYIPSKIFTKIHRLGIPNFTFYHWAAQLQFMSEWIKKKIFCFPDLEGIGLDRVQL